MFLYKLFKEDHHLITSDPNKYACNLIYWDVVTDYVLPGYLKGLCHCLTCLF